METGDLEDPRTTRARGRQKALFLVVASGLVLVAHGVDVVQAGGPNWAALAVRLGWAALLLLNAATLLRGSRRAIRVVSTAAALGTTCLYLALLAVTGLSRSPLFSFAFVLAMLLPLFMAELRRAALASSALLLAGAFAALFLDGAPASEQLGWAHAAVVAFAVAWILAAIERRSGRAQAALLREREEARRRLAESQRLAAVGRLAAEVAHEVNNPLAVARSSANFLGAPGSGGDDESRAARDDLVAALERIAASVRRLGRQAVPDDDPPV